MLMMSCEMRFVYILFVLVFFVSYSFTQDITTKCLLDSVQIINAASNGQSWALRMLDASTKIPDGLLYGNIDHLGNYDECIQVKTPRFQGQYCRTILQISTNTPTFFTSRLPTGFKVTKDEEIRAEGTLFLRAAVCLPSSCDPDDVQGILQKYLPELLAPISGGVAPNVTAVVDPGMCRNANSEKPVSVWGWILIAILSVLLVVLMLATVLDTWGSKKSVFIDVFSVRTSTAQLFSWSPERGSVGCLHGLRVLSMAWIILGHRYETFLLTPISNIVPVFDTVVRKPLAMTVVNAFLAVDTFFFLSGFLITFVFFREMNRTKKFNVIKFYLYRFLRLTVPMAVVIVFYIALLAHMADGPNWEGLIGVRFRQFCEKNWWAALAYVNNYFGIFEQCLEQTWYTSVDMQLAWLSPLLLLPMYYSPSAALQLTSLLTAISCFIPFTITYLNNYPWTFDAVNTDSFDADGFVRDIYLPTHARATPYLIGMLLAYYIHNSRDKPLKLSQSVVIFGWIFCTASCLTIVYSLAIPHQKDYELEPVSSAFYAGFHRLGWSLGLAWIVMTCVKGYGGPVNAVLAWPGFQPLSKLTYAAYLIHILVMGGHTGSKRYTTYFSHYEVVRAFFGDLPIIFCVSLVLYLAVEAPLLIILRHVFNRGNQVTNKDRQSNKN